MFGRTPDYDQLREFGSIASVWLHERQRETTSKFGPTSKICVFMGYQEDMKAYRLWEPESRRMYKTSNADVFDGKYFDWTKGTVRNEQTSAERKVATEVLLNLPFDLTTEQQEMQEENVVTDDESVDTSVLVNDEDEVSDEASDDTSTVEQVVPEQQMEQPQAVVRQQRVSSRTTKGKAPERLGDWVCSGKPGQANLAAGIELTVSAEVEVPKTYAEMLKSPHKQFFLEAMQDEWRSLLEKKVCKLIKEAEAREGTKVISTKWVFDVKVNPNDQTIERFKARIVARGFQQEFGIDFDEIFAPVVSHTTIRCFLTFAAAKKMMVHHIDIKTAFLNSELDIKAVVKPPPGLGLEGYLLELDKALYGLKQAPKCWHEHFTGVLKEIGFEQLSVDQCVYVNRSDEAETFLLLYVDDCMLASTSPARIEHFKKQIASRMEMRDLGEITKFNGLNIEKDAHDGHFIVSHEQYIKECVETFGLKDAKRVLKLPPVETIKYDGTVLNEAQTKYYRSLVGSLLYICNITRPDICFAVNFLSRFMQSPTVQHWNYAKQVLNYANSTGHRKLHLGKFNNSQLVGFADASYGMSPDQRSQSGMIFTLFGSIVSWASKKQETTSKSTTEAEYVSLSAATDECLWIKQLLMDWGMKFTAPTPIFEDNQAVIKLVNNGQVNTRAKYLSTKLRSIYEYIKRGHINVQYVSTCDQWADMLTKSKVPLNVDQLFLGSSDSTTRGSVRVGVSSSTDTHAIARANHVMDCSLADQQKV